MKKLLPLLLLAIMANTLQAQAPELRNMMPNSWQKLTRLSEQEEKSFFEKTEVKTAVLNINDYFFQKKKIEEKYYQVFTETNSGLQFFRVLLCARSGLQIAGVAVSVASAVEDLDDSLLYRQEVLAHTRVSPEIQELMEAENISLTDAQTQLLAALISSAFVGADLNDAKKSMELIRKLDQLDDGVVTALKQSKRFGEKAFKNLNAQQINKLVKLPQKQFSFISELPTEELILFGKKFEQLSDIAVDSLKNLPNDLLLDIKNLAPEDVNVVAVLAGGEGNFMEAVFKERKAIIQGKGIEELVQYFRIPYTPKDKSLTMYQTRIWYKWRETKIPGLMEEGDSLEILEANARKAFEERNYIRQKARDCMINREWAERLQLKEGNKTWEDIIMLRKKNYDNNMTAVYQSIIDSSQQSRFGVDHMYGL